MITQDIPTNPTVQNALVVPEVPPKAPEAEPKAAPETPAPTPDKAPDPKPDDKIDPAKAAEQVKETAKRIDDKVLTEFSNEFSEKGDLSVESRKKLEEFGLPAKVVDAYLDGLRAQQDLVVNAAFEAAGGKDNYAAFSKWASESLPKEILGEFNKTVTAAAESRNLPALQAVVKQAYAQYQEAAGVVPNLLGGKAVPGGPKPFASMQQLVQAMHDPRYAKDPAYRQEVESRAAVSKI
jgi:hypothetical protein